MAFRNEQDRYQGYRGHWAESGRQRGENWNRGREWDRDRDWDREEVRIPRRESFAGGPNPVGMGPDLNPSSYYQQGGYFGPGGYADPSGWALGAYLGGYETGHYGEEEFSRRGSYAGRGPRNYRRSGERIREDVCDALCQDPELDASDIEVSVEDGEVTLSGSVRSRAQKRHAEDLAERCAGVEDVHNRLKVH